MRIRADEAIIFELLDEMRAPAGDAAYGKVHMSVPTF